ncbi:MAG TPA: polyprenyl synthetase family protein, partial [Candidatus Dormibacteraeota bacterium]
MAERVLDIDASPPLEGQPALLDRHTDLLDHGLRRSTPRTRGLLRQMSAYHLGWIDAQGRPANEPAGKRIRPALTLWACESLGGDPAWALPAAVAVELIHNFTLIHDDIQDGDQLRRHRPTVWTIWGAEQGINAGDGMFANALSGLLAPGPRPGRRMRAAHLLSGAVVQVVEGQCLDLALEGRAGAPQATYLRLVTMKTGALIGAAMAAGAVLAGAPRAVARRFDAAGRLLGLAFQVRDDWLGTWGDPQVTGKGRSGDLRRRKLTYPVVAAYEVATPARRRELRRLFREREPGGEFRLRALLDDLGGPSLTAGVPMVLARDAVAALTGLPDQALTD